VRAALGLAVAAAAPHLVPSVLTVPALHARIAPALSGRAPTDHVALTFDDGPDPASTPQFLDELDRLGIRATFFVLGRRLAEFPDLGREVVARGHDVGVHGWVHRPHLLRTPQGVYADLRRTTETVRAVVGVRPRFARPPNGVITGAGLWSARRLGLRTVLWTADGRDWQAAATPESVTDRITRRLRGGGVVLLHDSDITSASGSWRSALGALPLLADWCDRHGWPLGTLSRHWQDGG
jgi:peptidoglycan-N-acetylglucosamine deacetylase